MPWGSSHIQATKHYQRRGVCLTHMSTSLHCKAAGNKLPSLYRLAKTSDRLHCVLHQLHKLYLQSKKQRIWLYLNIVSLKTTQVKMGSLGDPITIGPQSKVKRGNLDRPRGKVMCQYEKVAPRSQGERPPKKAPPTPWLGRTFCCLNCPSKYTCTPLNKSTCFIH